MEEFVSRYSFLFASRRVAPCPETITIGSLLSQSPICVKGCQTNFWSSAASEWILGLRFTFHDLLQRACEFLNVGRFMSCRNRHAQPRLPARHGWKTNARHVNIVFEQRLGGVDRPSLVTDDDRDNCAG